MPDLTIMREGCRSFLKIGNESVELSNYQVKSSADGNTELLVKIKGTSTLYEMSASLKEQTQEFR